MVAVAAGTPYIMDYSIIITLSHISPYVNISARKPLIVDIHIIKVTFSLFNGTCLYHIYFTGYFDTDHHEITNNKPLNNCIHFNMFEYEQEPLLEGCDVGVVYILTSV